MARRVINAIADLLYKNPEEYRRVAKQLAALLLETFADHSRPVPLRIRAFEAFSWGVQLWVQGTPALCGSACPGRFAAPGGTRDPAADPALRAYVEARCGSRARLERGFSPPAYGALTTSLGWTTLMSG